MPYIPHTESDVAEMLKTIGVASIDDLFVEIPDNLKLKGNMNVAPGMDEYALGRFFSSLAAKNLNATTLDWFLSQARSERSFLVANF
jgi:glycine dehydrogenase subunit 1